MITLMRGLPGSGKSTKAATLAGVAVSADDYRYVNGTYDTTPGRGIEAHGRCQSEAVALLYGSDCDVVIDNTNCTLGEMVFYARLALMFDQDLMLIDLFDAGLSDEELAARTKHSVPIYVIAAMRARYWRGSVEELLAYAGT